MPLFSSLAFDCMLILVISVIVTQVAMPLARRELTFPLLRKLINAISKPKKETNDKQ